MGGNIIYVYWMYFFRTSPSYGYPLCFFSVPLRLRGFLPGQLLFKSSWHAPGRAATEA